MLNARRSRRLAQVQSVWSFRCGMLDNELGRSWF
jgi:hypothetical protein